jgi:hypothetical protein
MIQAKKLVEALAGLVLTVVETAFLATYNLLPWNPGTRPWLVAGGVFGLLVGVTIGLQIPLTTGTWRFMITRIATPEGGRALWIRFRHLFSAILPQRDVGQVLGRNSPRVRCPRARAWPFRSPRGFSVPGQGEKQFAG